MEEEEKKKKKRRRSNSRRRSSNSSSDLCAEEAKISRCLMQMNKITPMMPSALCS